jgi:hypothetical protein
LKKLLITLVLSLVSTSAFAEWTKVGEDDESTVYTDPSTVRKKGELTKIWSLYDFTQARVMSGKTYLSMEKQYEIDCANGKTRAMYIIYYAQKMGGGEKGAFDYPPKQWQPVAPNSAVESIWKAACGKQ